MTWRVNCDITRNAVPLDMCCAGQCKEINGEAAE